RLWRRSLGRRRLRSSRASRPRSASSAPPTGVGSYVVPATRRCVTRSRRRRGHRAGSASTWTPCACERNGVLVVASRPSRAAQGHGPMPRRRSRIPYYRRRLTVLLVPVLLTGAVVFVVRDRTSTASADAGTGSQDDAEPVIVPPPATTSATTAPAPSTTLE